MTSLKELGAKVKQEVPLSEHTTFKIGGPAAWFYEAETEAELVKAVNLAKELKMPCLILGGGSNLLVGDEGFRGLVVKSQVSSLMFQKEKIKAGAGTPLARIVEEAASHSFSGLEFCVGIPGTIGGAVVGNAGVKEKAIGDLIEEVKVLNEAGEVEFLNQAGCQFQYRASRFQKEHKIILEVTLSLKKGSEPEIRGAMARFLEARKDQPREPSAGSVFKNPPPPAGGAGELIEKVGLKGKTIGKAQISVKHANWIINLGGASCQDVLKLISLAKKKVKEKFGLELREEIRVVGGQ